MTRSCHPLPKHVRESRDAIADLGAATVEVRTRPTYGLAWDIGGVHLHLRLPHTPSGNTVEEVRHQARRLMRQRGLAVPA